MLSEKIVRDERVPNTWPLVAQEMDAQVEAGPEYRALLQRLTDDDLPASRENFKKRQLNVQAIREVVDSARLWKREREDIKRHVGTINQSLQDIRTSLGPTSDWNPATTDADVRDFRAQLLACTGGHRHRLGRQPVLRGEVPQVKGRS